MAGTSVGIAFAVASSEYPNTNVTIFGVVSDRSGKIMCRLGDATTQFAKAETWVEASETTYLFEGFTNFDWYFRTYGTPHPEKPRPSRLMANKSSTAPRKAASVRLRCCWPNRRMPLAGELITIRAGRHGGNKADTNQLLAHRKMRYRVLHIAHRTNLRQCCSAQDQGRQTGTSSRS